MLDLLNRPSFLALRPLHMRKFDPRYKIIIMCTWSITLFRLIVVFCGTDNIMQNIFHIQPNSKHSAWMWRILCIILLVPQNIAMSLNNVMSRSPTQKELKLYAVGLEKVCPTSRCKVALVQETNVFLHDVVTLTYDHVLLKKELKNLQWLDTQQQQWRRRRQISLFLRCSKSEVNVFESINSLTVCVMFVIAIHHFKT